MRGSNSVQSRFDIRGLRDDHLARLGLVTVLVWGTWLISMANVLGYGGGTIRAGSHYGIYGRQCHDLARRGLGVSGSVSMWHNPGVTPVNLEGWYLANQADNLRKWRFPAVTFPPVAIWWSLPQARTGPGVTISFTLTSVSMRQESIWPGWNRMEQRSPGNMHLLILCSFKMFPTV